MVLLKQPLIKFVSYLAVWTKRDHIRGFIASFSFVVYRAHSPIFVVHMELVHIYQRIWHSPLFIFVFICNFMARRTKFVGPSRSQTSTYISLRRHMHLPNPELTWGFIFGMWHPVARSTTKTDLIGSIFCLGLCI